MIGELITLIVKKREIPFYYFKYLYRKHITNYLDYISLKEQILLVDHKSLHNPDYVSLINNKLYFALFCEKTSIKTPKLVSYNLGANFFFNGEVTKLETKEELHEFYEKVFDQHGMETLFFRPPSDFGGKGCFKLAKSDFKNDLDTIYRTLIHGNYVHTEVIEQHEDINQIHGKSVNTLRIISLVTSDGVTEIISAVLRLGVGNSVVDNATSGGFFVGVDLKEGTLKAVGHYLPEHGGGEITEHPDSGFKFEGFKVPYFKEACQTVIEGVKIIPDRFIGWDIAITPKGPIVIETNAEPHIPVSDISYGGLLQNKHVKNVVEELKSIKD